MLTQLTPPASQRSHCRDSVGAGEPDHVPSLPVNVEPTAAVPLIVGTESFAGGAVITPVAAESAATVPTEFVPVTSTRMRFPASPPPGTYVWLVAPTMLAQFAP